MICNKDTCKNTIKAGASKFCSPNCYFTNRKYDYKTSPITAKDKDAIVHLGGGLECIISAEDVALVGTRLWHYSPKNGVTSNKRRHEKENNRPGHIKMHRLIMQAPTGMVVDHISGDKLDNSRVNLRVVTNAQNLMNMKSRPMRNIEFSNGSYCVRIKAYGVRHYVGRYKDIDDAILARDEAAITIQEGFRNR